MIKPSVVFIRGVHSTTGHDTDSDIGFPQLELEKLFEGATIKVTADTAYDSSKQYIYYNSPNNPVAIQDAGYFNCIKNGYYSIANGINHYYTKSSNNYNYNAVPDTSTWAGKWGFSNAITGKNLYSINSETNQIFIDSDGYYKKENNNYVKQTVKTYDLYNEGLQVFWDDSHKYIQKPELDMTTFQNIVMWKSGDTLATNGYYLSVDEKPDGTFIVKLLYCTFENGILQDEFTDLEALYKLDTDDSFGSNTWYIKNSDKLERITANTNIVFNTDPTESSNFYLYQKLGSYTYPNTIAPETALLYTESGSTVYKDFNIDNFPLYTIATVTEISKTQHGSYTVYERSAVKINYNYSIDANSLKFVFTDKDIDGVLETCNLPNDLKKYVHLTNLRYNEN